MRGGGCGRCGSRRRCGLDVSRGGCSPRIWRWSVGGDRGLDGRPPRFDGRGEAVHPGRGGGLLVLAPQPSTDDGPLGVGAGQGEELAQVLLDGVGVQDLQAGSPASIIEFHSLANAAGSSRSWAVSSRRRRAVACVSTLRIFKLSKPCQRATGESPQCISLPAFLREPGPDLRLAVEFGPDTSRPTCTYGGSGSCRHRD